MADPDKVNLRSTLRAVVFLSILLIPLTLPAIAQDAGAPENKPPAPPTEVRASDTPNDDGSALTITWTKSQDDGAGDLDVIAYKILRSETPDTGFSQVASAIAGEVQYVDSVRTGVTYYYKVAADDGECL